MVNLAANAASTVSTSSFGLRVYQVVFDVGWDGGNITLSGVDRLGISANETFTSPGAGGGTVTGSKVLLGKVTMLNSNPAGSALYNARAQFRSVLPTAYVPVAAFVRASDITSGAQATGVTTDLTNGWIDGAGLGTPLASLYTVLYTYTLP